MRSTICSYSTKKCIVLTTAVVERGGCLQREMTRREVLRAELTISESRTRVNYRQSRRDLATQNLAQRSRRTFREHFILSKLASSLAFPFKVQLCRAGFLLTKGLLIASGHGVDLSKACLSLLPLLTCQTVLRFSSSIAFPRHATNVLFISKARPFSSKRKEPANSKNSQKSTDDKLPTNAVSIQFYPLRSCWQILW